MYKILYILPINIVVLDEHTLYISYFLEYDGDDEPRGVCRELDTSEIVGKL